MGKPITSALAAVAALWSSAAWAAPPMWTVRDKDSEVVIFGSVHLLPPSLMWKPAALDSALARADDVWFELPQGPTAETEVAQLAAQHGTLPPGQSLFTLLPPADSQRLLRLARAYGVDPAVLTRLKPWLAELAVTGASFTRAGAVMENGVEAVTQATTPAATPRRAFETPAEQIAMMSATPQDEQIAALRESMAELETDAGQFDDLIRAWMAGDLTALDREALGPMKAASPRLYARLVTDRTARWAVTVDQRLKGAGRTVVIVGVGHLIGPEGLPGRLRALGYSVTGP